MRDDPGQRAAIEATANAVVRAGAGAGKTSVLVRRYVRLVEDGMPVNRILTLTFTRKAASEMHERIYRELARRAADGSDHLREQLRDFDSATVSTLDSFCAAVARSGCRRYGLAPTFTVDEIAFEEFCDELALRFIMAHTDTTGSVTGRQSLAMRSLLRLNRFTGLLHDGFGGLARDHFLVSRALDVQGMARDQREHLIGQLEDLAIRIRSATAGIAGLDPDAAKCVAGAVELVRSLDLQTLDRGRIGPVLRSVSGSRQLPGKVRQHIVDQRTTLARLGDLKLQCGASRKPEVAEYKELVKAIRAAAAEMDENLLALLSWHEVTAAAELAEAFQSVVIEQKRRTGILSYQDVVALAISVLRDDEEIRMHYKNRFSSIMIDEFQDNNEEQKQLLFLLAEREDRHSPGIPSAADLAPDKLFFVGDEKQSIYRFRGADVSVFKRLSDELGGEQSQIVLGSNYRSEPGLISFFNSLFGRIFVEPEAGYEARFDPLGSRDGAQGVTPSVQLWKLLAPDDPADYLRNDEAEAWHIARTIREAVDGGSLQVPAPGGGIRAAGYGDFAVLMRASGFQTHLERMMRLFAVPYVAQTARSLFLEAPLNDIYNPLQLVLHPRDRVALAAYLRSPLVGMGDNGVVRVLLQAADLSREVEGLDQHDTSRHRLALERYTEIIALADTRPVTELVHHVWYRWGYRNHLLRSPEYHAYLEHYDYIYELARLHGKGGLAEFLSVIRRNKGRNQRPDELNIVQDRGDGVKLMTIHKAKGLEFPVVIVANTGNRGRSDRISDAPFYNSRRHGLVFNIASSEADRVKEKPLNPIYGAESDRAKAENRAELRRLLYVASTRAQVHLIYSGHLRGNDQSLLAMIDGPFAAAESELAEDHDLTIASAEFDPVPRAALAGGTPRHGETGKADSRPDPFAAEAPEPSLRSYPPRAFTATALNAADLNAAALNGATAIPGAARQPERAESRRKSSQEELLVDSVAYRGYADMFGTYVHYCIEQLGRGSATPRQLSEPQRISARLRPDLPHDDLQRYFAEGIDLASRFLESEFWAQTHKAVSTEFELPFLLAAVGVRIRGKMDLVIEFGNRVVVVDFKSDRSLSPGHYSVQLSLYRRAAASIFNRDATAFLYDVRAGTSILMDEDVSDSRLAEIVAMLVAEPISPDTP